MTGVCENYSKCPIYSGVLKSNEMASSAYKRQYCENVPAGRDKCKRYIISKKIGKCPPNILPNASRSVEELIEMHAENA